MAVIMVLVNHYFAFSHFGEKYYPFSEVILRNSEILKIWVHTLHFVFVGDGLLHPLHVARAIRILRVSLCQRECSPDCQ